MADNTYDPKPTPRPPPRRKPPIRDVLEFARVLLAIECLAPCDDIGRGVHEMCVREGLALGWVLAEHANSPVMDDCYDPKATWHLTTLGIAAARWGGAEVIDGGLARLEE